jgi:PTEN phosphatase family protein
VRAVRLIAELPRLKRALRRVISQNKRRLITEEFELDLTFITDRVIAMSLPATWLESFYRNEIDEVARCVWSNFFFIFVSTSA